MAERQANIDLIFRNGLKDYEVLPPPEVWDNIRPDTAKRSMVFSALRIAAVSLVVIGVGASSYFMTRNLSRSLDGSAMSLNQDAMPAGFYIERSEPLSHNIDIAQAEIPVTRKSDDVYKSSPAFYLDEVSLFKPIIREKSAVRSADNSLPRQLITQPASAFAGDNDYYIDKDAASSTPVVETGRWSVGATLTPTYYSRFNFSGNDAGKDLIDAEKAAVSYSGGVSFSYAVSKRISIQSGIYYSSLGQKVTGVNSYSGFGSYFESKGPGDFIVQTSSGSIISNNHDIYLLDGNESGRVLTQYTLDVFDPVKSDLDYVNNSLHQNFNYLELPIVMRYKIFDRKIDFNLIGAISYNILLANSAYTYLGGVKTYIGKTDGLSPVTLSSAVGMGVEYNLTEHLLFNLEPTFRYYMTPLGGIAGSSIHPYSFGVLSGVFFRF